MHTSCIIWKFLKKLHWVRFYNLLLKYAARFYKTHISQTTWLYANCRDLFVVVTRSSRRCIPKANTFAFFLLFRRLFCFYLIVFLPERKNQHCNLFATLLWKQSFIKTKKNLKKAEYLLTFHKEKLCENRWGLRRAGFKFRFVHPGS